jgi:hypothetical protein
VIPAYGPGPLVELFWGQAREAGREHWFFERPPVPFEVPWASADEFWQRATEAIVLTPWLQDDERFKASSRLMNAKGILTRDEQEYLRAYNWEMVETGSGYHITLAEQHGVLAHHLIPFFVLLADLYRTPKLMPVTFPWTDFPARYEELSGGRYKFPDYALVPIKAKPETSVRPRRRPSRGLNDPRSSERPISGSSGG